MSNRIKIACMVYGGGETTLGMDIVVTNIREHVPNIDICIKPDINQAKESDYLLVSLYWWKDIYEHVKFLHTAGIDPRKRKPIIIIGGMSALNPFVLDGYYHYAVIGDGETTGPELLKALIDGNEDVDLKGVVTCRDKEGYFSPHVEINPQHYIETRTNKTTRIEIARGCKFKCPFCELAAIKPYRELPYEIIRHLILTSPTKNIALFAPDRASHSRYLDIEKCVMRAGKRNTGNDLRLDSIKKHNIATTLRFGIEAFTAEQRRKIKGIKTNEDLIEYFRYIFEEVKTPKGKPITTATAYMIADLPGERSVAAIEEFSDTLRRIDEICNRKFTLFLSVAGFMPAPYTRMERDALNPYSKFNKLWDKHRYRTKNIIIASRGAVVGPSTRIAQMMTIRGDEQLKPLIYWLGTTSDGRKILADRTENAGKILEKLILKTGTDPEFIYRELGKDEKLPSDRIKKWENVDRKKATAEDQSLR